MSAGILPRLLTAASLLAACTLAQALERLPPGALLIELSNRQAVAAEPVDVQALVEALPTRGADVALDALHGIVDPLAFEFAAARVIEAIQSGVDSPAARAVLEALAQSPVRVYRRQEETAADWFVPAFDVPGRAQSALRLLRLRAATDLWQRDLADDPARALAALALADDEARRAVTDAIASLSDAQAGAVLQRARIADLDLPSGLWAALAARLSHREAFDALARHGSEADVLVALTNVDALPSADAVHWLLTLGQRPRLRSAALLALAAHARPGSAALAHLVEQLADADDGPSAALALTRRPDADRIALIDSLLTTQTAPHARANLALALRLEGSEQARRALQRHPDAAPEAW